MRAYMGDGLFLRRRRRRYHRCLERHAPLTGHRRLLLDFRKNGQADCAEFEAKRNIDVDALFMHEFKLDQANAAYKLFDTQTTGKGVFLMN